MNKDLNKPQTEPCTIHDVRVRNSQVIAREIEKLKMEYTRVRRRELEKIACNKEVVERLNKKWYVVVTNTGCWWCDDGNLQERCWPDEMQSLRNLEREGVVKQSEHVHAP